MTIDTCNLNDDISDLFGGTPTGERRQLPMDEASVRIRATVPVFAETCPKCKGSGRFTSYSGRTLGQCFTCKGAGKRTFKTAPEVRERARDRAAEQRATVVADHKAEIQWLITKLQSPRLPEGYAAMLRDFLDKLSNGRSLTDGQLAVVTKGMARDAEYAAQRAQQAEQRMQAAPLVDVSKLVAAFEFRAKAAKKAILRFNGVTLSLKNDGVTIYVKSTDRKVEGQYGLQGEYLGKIVEGRFVATRACTPADIEALKVAAADPLVAAVAYGRTTSSCSCCGLTLTNALSIELGIGPICRSKWGF